MPAGGNPALADAGSVLLAAAMATQAWRAAGPGIAQLFARHARSGYPDSHRGLATRESRPVTSIALRLTLRPCPSASRRRSRWPQSPFRSTDPPGDATVS
jgi:hypothetical protein